MKNLRRTPSYRLLEQKCIFDGAAAVAVADAAVPTDANAPPGGEADVDATPDLFAAVSISLQKAASQPKSIVFIDSAVSDLDLIVDAVPPGAEVVFLDAARDGVLQIAAALQGRSGIDAIHIVSHGAEGRLYLGTGSLTASSMQAEYLDDLMVIGQAMSAEGDILIYGCEFTAGETGLEAAMILGGITGADIAASTDATGNMGDWLLETQTGPIETRPALDAERTAEYSGQLSTAPVGQASTVQVQFDSYIFKSSDFPFTDANGNALAAVRIASLPSQGIIRLDGQAVSVGQEVAAANIAAGRLVYFIPAGGAQTESHADAESGASDTSSTAPSGAEQLDTGDNTDMLDLLAAASGSVTGPVSEPTTIVFIDADVTNVNELIGLLKPGTEVVQLSAVESGLQQIADYLEGRSDIDSIDIISHGSAGHIFLGSDVLTSETLDQHADALRNIGAALSDTGDIRFFGCDVSSIQEGVDLIAAISEITGADVAASDNMTGSDAYSGDWILETTWGHVEDSAMLSEYMAWEAKLAIFTVTNTNNSGAGSFRQAILDANALAGLDTIRFLISGTGVHTITPLSVLPLITDSVIIDGTTDDSFAANGNRPAIEIVGTNLQGLFDWGLRLGANADGSTIRGLVIRDWGADGIHVQAGSNNNTIVGNYIGRLTAAGTISAAGTGNSYEGIWIEGANNVIGGTTAADRNVISGNGQSGVMIEGAAATGNVVQGNWIGLDSSGAATLGNLWAGVRLSTSTANNMIGGVAAGAGNVIAGQTSGDGIELSSDAGSGNSILGNSIYSNSESGIDIDDNGVTANDLGDGDTGANSRQNFPVLFVASFSGGATTVSGSLNSAANTTYRIEFFASSNADPTGYGEGQTYIGAVSVTTDSAGFAYFNANLSGVALQTGQTVSATATIDLGNGTYGSTSEFAANINANTTARVGVAADTYIKLKSPDTNNNFGASTSLIIDRETTDLQRGLLYFDLGAIPTNATITSASLQMQATQIGGTLNISVYEMLNSWSEGSSDGTSGSSNWNQRSTGLNWSNAGGDFNSTAVANLNTNVTGTHSWNLTSLVQSWVSGSKVNNGVVIASPDGGGNRTVTYDSSEGGTPPAIVVTYTFPNPVVTSASTALSYTENAAATAIDPSLTVTDADSTNLTGATVRITSNYANGQDVLAFTNQNGITGSWNPSTGTLTLSGSATVAQYQAALRSVTYVNTSEAPSIATRTVSFSATDGTWLSALATRNITVAAVNDAPVASNDTFTTNEDTAVTFDVRSNDTDERHGYRGERDRGRHRRYGTTQCGRHADVHAEY